MFSLVVHTDNSHWYLESVIQCEIAPSIGDLGVKWNELAFIATFTGNLTTN